MRDRNNQTATEAFLAAKAKIDDLIATLAAQSEDHFDVDPDNIDWGHVGSLNRIRELLEQAAIS